MVSSCYEKCMDKKFKDGDLNVGEAACVDRCTGKYWQTVGIVGSMLGAADAQAQQQQMRGRGTHSCRGEEDEGRPRGRRRADPR
jgi:import inner membrane translocase subunit TIM10